RRLPVWWLRGSSVIVALGITRTQNGGRVSRRDPPFGLLLPLLLHTRDLPRKLHGELLVACCEGITHLAYECSSSFGNLQKHRDIRFAEFTRDWCYLECSRGLRHGNLPMRRSHLRRFRVSTCRRHFAGCTSACSPGSPGTFSGWRLRAGPGR